MNQKEITKETLEEVKRRLVEIKDLRVWFYYEEGIVKAVDGISLEIEREKVLGLAGESGCGKSVTALSILNLIPQPPAKIEGGITLYREKMEPLNLIKLNPKGDEIRQIRGKEISMIFQEPMTSLNPVYTIGEQIIENIILHQKVDRTEARKRAIEMLEKVEISSPEKRVDDYPHQMSGGMRQRVMIAMALSCNPSLLIADEPTTAVDVTIQAQILELMKNLQREFHSAILLITHDLGVIAEMADEVAVMYMGQIVEYANVREIFHNPLHPYTQGLLKSVPVLGKDTKKRLVPIEGVVPDPYHLPKGCRFRPRCEFKNKGCSEISPPLVEYGENHLVRCNLYGS